MKVTSQERNRLVIAWFWTCFWNGLLVSFGLLAWHAQSTAPHPTPLHLRDSFLLLFPASGIAFLVWAIRETVLWKMYGPTFFVADGEIIPWAAKVDGRILFSRPLPAVMGRSFTLTLTGLYDEGTGKNRQVAVMWKDSHGVDLVGDAIPVSFSLPSETKPCPLIVHGAMQLRLNVKGLSGGFRSFAAEYHLPFAGGPDDDPFAERKRDFQRRIRGAGA